MACGDNTEHRVHGYYAAKVPEGHRNEGMTILKVTCLTCDSDTEQAYDLPVHKEDEQDGKE
jgi:hypothetical protein